MGVILCPVYSSHLSPEHELEQWLHTVTPRFLTCIHSKSTGFVQFESRFSRNWWQACLVHTVTSRFVICIHSKATGFVGLQSRFSSKKLVTGLPQHKQLCDHPARVLARLDWFFRCEQASRPVAEVWMLIELQLALIINYSNSDAEIHCL